nr:ABC transporter permease [uncultured Arsenicibacter sp.]
MPDKPPRLATRLLHWFCPPHLAEELEGDLDELFQQRIREAGLRQAQWRYLRDVISLVPLALAQRNTDTVFSQKPTNTIMIRNYFKIAWRTLLHQKGYSLINVTGLALGLAACIVISLIVRNELTYDSYHKKADRTYRMTVHGLDYNPSVSFAVAPAFRTDFPEAEHVSQFFYRPEGMIKAGNQRFSEKGFAFADSAFSQVFDFNWLAGDAKTALTEPNTIVLTESLAKKYFGDRNPMGQLLRLNNRLDLRVTGIISDLPANTHLRFNFLVSWESVRKDMDMAHFWSIAGGSLYIVLPEHLNPERISARFPAFLTKNWDEQIRQDKGMLLLQPLREIHFDQRYLNQITMPRSKETIYGLACVALFIILTACINFINLATAQAVRRSKEVGIRKTLGAYRRQLIGQALGETSMLVGIAAVLALFFVRLFLPYAKDLLDIRLTFTQLGEPQVIAGISGILIATILLAGLYPGFVQSGFLPTKALKSRMTNIHLGGLAVRKGLVMLQFAITQVIIIGTLVVASQMDFFMNQDLGYAKEAIVLLSAGDKPDVFLQKLRENPGVQQFSFASAAPSYNNNFAPFKSPERGLHENDVTELKHVDEQYISLHGLSLLAGDPIRKRAKGDTLYKVVVNQTLIRRLGFTDAARAIGHRFFIGNQPVLIQGVVRDFQSESKHKQVRPCILVYNPGAFWQVSIKLHPQHMRETLAEIEADWVKLNPEYIFQYEFVDDHLAQLYTQESNMYNAFRIFSAISILIGSLGLLGLVSLIAVQRTKEIGIRKVLGASSGSIAVLFSREFLVLMSIAFCVAAPLAWYGMSNWLRQYAYHINIGPSIYLITFFSMVILVVVTISYQSLKAALMNPVKSLRSE